MTWPDGSRWAASFQRGRRGIDQHAEPRTGDRFRTHPARDVNGANGKPVFSLSAPMKQEVLLRGWRLGVEFPTSPPIYRNVELDFHRLPRRIVGLIDAEGNGEVRLLSDDRLGRRGRSGRCRLAEKRQADEQS